MAKLKRKLKFMPMSPVDIERCVAALPVELYVKLVNEPVKWSGCVAGGFIRSVLMNVDAKDIDFFPYSFHAVPNCPYCDKKCWDSASISSLGEANEIEEAIYALTFECRKPAIQAVHRPDYRGDTLEDTISKFDTTVSMAGICYDTDRDLWVGQCVESYYEDLAAKRIVVVNPMRMMSYRVGRFLELGFDVPNKLVAEAIVERLTA